MSEKQLQPCPFCGGDAQSDTMRGFLRMSDGKPSNAVTIYCTKCAAEMSLCHDDHPKYTPDEMLTVLSESWNLRAGAVCSVCGGKSLPPQNGERRCICGGAGSHAAEVEGLRAMAASLRDEIGAVLGFLQSIGFSKANNPSDIIPAVTRLHQRALDAELEFVKLKERQRT